MLCIHALYYIMYGNEILFTLKLVSQEIKVHTEIPSVFVRGVHFFDPSVSQSVSTGFPLFLDARFLLQF